MGHDENWVRITINPQISYTEIDDEMVILGEKSHQHYGLNSMGTIIFKKLLEQGAMSFDEICTALLEKHHVTPEQCAIDLKPFIQKMCHKNLLQME